MKLQVVESKSWRWYIAILLFLIVAMSLSAWLAWERSKIKRAKLGSEVTRLTENNQQLTETLAQKERLLTELDRTVQMSKANISEVAITLSKLEEDKKQLEKELTFYRSIMAPKMDKSGLSIDSLSITALVLDTSPIENAQQSDKQYEFELVLTQVKKQDWYIKGRYQIWLIEKPAPGQAEKRISLFTYLNKPKFKPRFSFRYFQTFREVIKIPAQLHPTAIVVTATTRDGKQKVEKRLPWPSEEKTADVQQKEN